MASSRREFIKKSLYGLLALLGLGFLVSGEKIFSPIRGRDKELVYFPLVPEEEVPRSGVKKSELVYTVSGKERKARVFIISSQEELTVLSATCSHLGCLVNYSREKHEFICPCHGGRYDLGGRNIAGPPPAPLSRIPVRIENGMVMVGIKV
jgi:Rieske Fe-S protein